ncbi:MAG TPA: MASE1 domain-containing protein [Gemmatimonadales bacterium]|nr:MASE1 domain-containing protein [Gemmatimonadales bacterium]
MRSLGEQFNGFSWLWRVAALAAVYFLVARLGLRYATIGASISPVWPPTGLAIGALTILGLRFWPAVLVGAFLANATTNIPILAAAGIACGNAAEATLGAYLLRRRAGSRVALDELAGILTLVLNAAPVGALASAAAGVTALWLAHVIPANNLPAALGLWWSGDYLGALVVAPALLTWRGVFRSPIARPEIMKLLLLVLGAVLATTVVFGNFVPPSFLEPAQYPYLLFPFVMGAALRFGPRGASVLTLTVALLAVAYTVRGGGPFVMQSLPNTNVALMIYVGVLAISGLLLSPAVARRVRAENALREAHGHLQAVINSSPLAIYTVDAAGAVQSWNPAAETLYGWRADELIGSPLARITQDMESRYGIRERVFRGETVRGIEIGATRKDGTPVTVSVAGAPLLDAPGRVSGMMLIAADLTEMRRLEVQYRQAQKMEAVGRLAGGIAHDFNNLLTAILGTTGLLLEDRHLAPQMQLDVHEIEKAAKRAAGLTRQLLVFSRQQVLEPRLLDLNAVVRDLERMLGRLIGEDVEVHTKLAAELGTVLADQGQLQQAIVNLVVNARDAMPKGGRVTIETADVELDPRQLEASALTQPGSYVLLAVHDTGAGMDAATKARLFEPFFTTKEPGHGTGLGLATVYSIVKQSSGYIWAYSELGQGATFKIYLPRVAGAPQAVTPSLATLAVGSETVLVVEDQAEVRALTTRILEARGYTVLAAENGSAAAQLADRYLKRIDLLLTDVVMPGVNGRELALRLAAQRRDIKVLFVSGYTGEAIRQHGLLELGAAFLQKPFTPDVLARKVRDVLDMTTPRLS